MMLSKKRITKALISWSGPLLFTYPEDRFSRAKSGHLLPIEHIKQIDQAVCWLCDTVAQYLSPIKLCLLAPVDNLCKLFGPISGWICFTLIVTVYLNTTKTPKLRKDAQRHAKTRKDVQRHAKKRKDRENRKDGTKTPALHKDT